MLGFVEKKNNNNNEKNEEKSIYTIQSDIRYPSKLLAGYPAKSVYGTTLMFTLHGPQVHLSGFTIV